MANGATPPATTAPNARDGKKKMNGNGGVRAVKEAGWKIVTASTLALVIGVATMLWSVNAKLAVIEATMVTNQELAEVMSQQPPPWFRDQVTRIETRLDDHFEQSAAQAHRGGG